MPPPSCGVLRLRHVILLVTAQCTVAAIANIQPEIVDSYHHQSKPFIASTQPRESLMRLHLFVQHLAQLHWYDTPFSIAQHQSATSFVGQSDKRKFSFFSQTTQRQHPKNFIALEFYFQAILLQSKSWGGIRDSNSCFGFHRPAPQPLGQSRHQTGAGCQFNGCLGRSAAALEACHLL